MSEAELHWQRFIELLNLKKPLKSGQKDDDDNPIILPHSNFLGSIAAYRKIFLEANAVASDNSHVL